MSIDIADIESQFLNEATKLKATLSSKSVEDLRVTYLGRKGIVTLLYDLLRNADPAKRPELGKNINLLKVKVEEKLTELKTLAEKQTLSSLVHSQGVDITLPTSEDFGALHPVTLMRRQLLSEFRKLGFSVYDGPEIDFDFYNFSALNFPDHHPARDMQDTFFVKALNPEKPMVMRTHTSNIQIHAMLNETPPLRVVALGRTFRCDSDLTHTPMFHQIEAVVVDQNISFAHMKGVISHFIKAIFGEDAKIRLRPSFFPFVEPGAEVDMACVACKSKGCRLCKETGWLEIGGCGMIHPNVFEAVNYDSERYAGFAFGFGIDRMAMLKYKLSDLRQLFAGQAEFLNQFAIFS